LPVFWSCCWCWCWLQPEIAFFSQNIATVVCARARRYGSGNTGTVGKIQCGDGASLCQQSLPPHEPAPPSKTCKNYRATRPCKNIFSYSLLQYPHSTEDKELWDIHT
jgi:hypothetical protein